MGKTKESASFGRRTSNVYHGHKKRCCGPLPYTLPDLRLVVLEALEQGKCPYCERALTTENFAADHMEPTSLGGRWTLENLVICCTHCNQCKGNMDDAEFTALLNLIRQFRPEARQSVLARLRAGGRVCGGRG